MTNIFLASGDRINKSDDDEEPLIFHDGKESNRIDYQMLFFILFILFCFLFIF